MRKIRTIVVDDEPLAREGVRMMLEADSNMAVIAECTNGTEAVGIKQMPCVIFVTAYDKYAMQAFEVNALDYLLKPFTFQRFSTALERVKNQISNDESSNLSRKLMSLLEGIKPSSGYLERIIVKNAGRVFFINVESISWIEAAAVYVRAHTGGQSYLVRGAISKLEENLDPTEFLRVHRSTIVSIKQVKELQPLYHVDYEITLLDGTKLTSSRGYRDRLQIILENSF